MNSELRLPLTTTPEQTAQLMALQAAFAQVCNALAPLVQQSRVWNRVALHHMAYKTLRAQFPSIGSQMVCNAIYSVARHSRAFFQGPDSPFNLNRLGQRPLPLLRFSDTCPVYFDRHTLSLKDSMLSLFTLDGRVRFKLSLAPQDEARFHEQKLREIVLRRQAADGFELLFRFSETDDSAAAEADAGIGELPEYVMVIEDNPPSAMPEAASTTGSRARGASQGARL